MIVPKVRGELPPSLGMSKLTWFRVRNRLRGAAERLKRVFAAGPEAPKIDNFRRIFPQTCGGLTM